MQNGFSKCKHASNLGAASCQSHLSKARSDFSRRCYKMKFYCDLTVHSVLFVNYVCKEVTFVFMLRMPVTCISEDAGICQQVFGL